MELPFGRCGRVRMPSILLEAVIVRARLLIGVGIIRCGVLDFDVLPLIDVVFVVMLIVGGFVCAGEYSGWRGLCSSDCVVVGRRED